MYGMNPDQFAEGGFGGTPMVENPMSLRKPLNMGMTKPFGFGGLLSGGNPFASQMFMPAMGQGGFAPHLAMPSRVGALGSQTNPIPVGGFVDDEAAVGGAGGMTGADIMRGGVSQAGIPVKPGSLGNLPNQEGRPIAPLPSSLSGEIGMKPMPADMKPQGMGQFRGRLRRPFNFFGSNGYQF